MKKIHIDGRRRCVLQVDSFEEDGESLLARSGNKVFKVALDRVLYVEEDGRAAIPRQEGPIMPVGLQTSEPRPPILNKTFVEAVQKNMSSKSKVAMKVILEGAVSGDHSVMVSPETATAADTNEELVGEIFSSPVLSEVLRGVRVVGFKKNADTVIINTRDREPVLSVNLPAALTSIMSQVGSLVSPTTRLPDIKEDFGEDT